MFHVATRQRGDWVPELKVGGNSHSMAYRPAGLAATTHTQLPCKSEVVVIWNHSSQNAIAEGCAALESCGATVSYSSGLSSPNPHLILA